MRHASRWAITALAAIAALVVTVSGQDYYRSGGGGAVTSPVTAAVIQGGSGTTSTLTLQPTSGVGTTGADIVFKVGNNGATEALRLKNDGTFWWSTDKVQFGTGAGGNPYVYVHGGLGSSNGPGFFADVTGDIESRAVLDVNTSGLGELSFGQGSGARTWVLRSLASDNTAVFRAPFSWSDGTNVLGRLSYTAVAGDPAIVAGTGKGFTLYTDNGGTTALAVTSAGVTTFASSVSATNFRSPTAKVLLQGTGAGATQLSTTQTTAPTCATNCGTSPTITGTDTFVTVTMGATGSPASGWVVTFNGTWPAAPACTVQMGKAGMAIGKMVLTAVTTTTTLTAVTNGVAPANGDVYHIHCGGEQ